MGKRGSVPRQPATNKVKVDPPEAEANTERKQPHSDSQAVAFRGDQTRHNAKDDLAQDDDGERPEAFDQGIGRGRAETQHRL